MPWEYRKHPKKVNGIKVEHCSNFSRTELRNFILKNNPSWKFFGNVDALSRLSRADLNLEYYRTLELLYPYRH